MTLRSSCNAARILLALTIFATLACNSVPSDAQSRKQLSDAYATYLEKHKKQRTSFGHDVDIKGKMIDLAKTFVDKTQIEPGCTVLMNHKVLLHINSPTNSKTAFS